jgi:suppressor of G2 allele of SKP1
LERAATTTPAINTETADAEAPQSKTIPPAILDTVPSYPTSSKSGPKNWDKLASDLTKKKAKEKSGGDDGGASDYDDEDGEGDPVNAFFKKLYKDADPDTRRAMVKSYQESNGTTLRTTGGEVG